MFKMLKPGELDPLINQVNRVKKKKRLDVVVFGYWARINMGKVFATVGMYLFFSTLTACAFLFYSPFCSVLKPPFLPCVFVYMGWVFGNTTESPIVF